MTRQNFLAASGAIVVAGSVPAMVNGQSTAALTVACTTGDDYAEALYAFDKGIFEKNGLNVNLQILTNGGAIANAVAGRAVDIGIVDVIPLSIAVEHGVPLTYLCSGGLNDNAGNSLCVAEGSSIRTGKDFNGKTIGTSSLNSIAVIAIKAWIDKYGGDSTTVHFFELPYSEMGPALQRGRIDAAPMFEPALTPAKKAGWVRVLSPPMYSVYGSDFMIGGWFTTAEWLESNRDIVRRFVAAIYETARWANTHSDESAVILAKYAKVDVSAIKGASRAPYGTSLTPRMVQSVLDLGYKYKVLDRAHKATEIIARI